MNLAQLSHLSTRQALNILLDDDELVEGLNFQPTPRQKGRLGNKSSATNKQQKLDYDNTRQDSTT